MFSTTTHAPLVRRAALTAAALTAAALLAAAALAPAGAHASSTQKTAFVAEGDNPNGGPAIGQIDLTCAADIECHYAVNPVAGTATTFKDWVPWRWGRQEYTVAAGQSKTVDVGVTVYGDQDVEGDETILATVDETRVMRWGKSGTSEEADPQVTHTVVVITNDDAKPVAGGCKFCTGVENENVGKVPAPQPTPPPGGTTPTTPGPVPTTPPVTPPAADKTAPNAAIVTRVARATKKGVVPVTVRCGAGEPDGCRIALTLRGTDGRVAGQAMVVLSGGEVRTLPVALNARARRLLARKRSLSLNAEIVATDPSGNAATNAAPIRVKSR